MGKAKKPATYEDLEALPVGWVGEILSDELVASPRPAMPHARVVWALGALLGPAFDLGQSGIRGGWWLLHEPELHLGRDIVVPDLAGWRRERVPVPSFMNEPFSTVAPDWACEVLSPSTEDVDRKRKLPLYHREGVIHVWLIDPSTRTLEVYRRQERDWLRVASHRGDGEVLAEPFDALPLKLGSLWWPRAGATQAPVPSP
ncbi:Uma2 family endonuclease [Archangium violaceum]|uniref:Uma2 family endonuclease n=1 Tax=Archangium violaceum TaxID=83451 RepID=UPI00193B6924|nr:Uma2 family endonuclease [Archangium violaceum]QRK06600.1 Uma2 family endonuclease [Archangium violaceum]